MSAAPPLVMLAPANHGSALAQLGKGRLARLKTFLTDGVQPGIGVLDWLELGRDQGWALNLAWLGYDCVGDGLFPFGLAGQQIDRSLYGNLNYGLMRLVQTDTAFALRKAARTKPTAFGVLPGRAHSGEMLGILRGVRGPMLPA